MVLLVSVVCGRVADAPAHVFLGARDAGFVRVLRRSPGEGGTAIAYSGFKRVRAGVEARVQGWSLKVKSG